MEKWSDRAWEAALPWFNRIKELPFLRELAGGTLPPEVFRYYISQDNLYIDVYTRVLAHIASRLPDMADVETFLRFASDGVAVEKGLHAAYNPDRKIGKSAVCEFYTSYLRARAQEDIAVETASILPCFWVYLEVGKHILSTARLEDNPYRPWIETYSDPAFDESNRCAIDICDRLAAAATEAVRVMMTQVFVECTRLEYFFWESAYRLGKDENLLMIK